MSRTLPRLLAIGAALAALLVSSGAAAAPTVFSSGDLTVAIPDPPGLLSVPLDITNTGQIADVNVSVRLDHPRDRDVDLTLRGPDGTVVDLSSDNGDVGLDYGDGGTDDCSATGFTVFDDEATALVTSGVAPFSGPFKPEQELTAFDGKTANGQWRLEIGDDEAGPGGPATLYCWKLEITFAQADLGVTLTDGPDPAAVGAALTYTATVKNNGPDSSGTTTLTFVAPTGATLSTTTPSQGTCKTDVVPAKCDLGALASGASATVAFVVEPVSAGSVAATATVSTGATDPVTTNDTATEPTTVQADGSGGSETVTVTKEGDGTGTVTSSPAGITCGTACQAGFIKGAQVTLTATPAAGSVVGSWGGACEGTAPVDTCVVTADGAKEAFVTFTKTSAAGTGGGGTSGDQAGGPTGGQFYRCTITGTDKANVLRGTSKRDVICGLGGNDKIYGLGGNDVLIGGGGKDLLVGGAGNDVFYSKDRSSDRVFGGPGKDKIGSVDVRDEITSV